MLALPPTGNGRLWVCAYYNGGAVALGVFNASSPTQICPLVEGQVVTTAASTNGGNTVGTHYANVSSITNTPFRILGYIEWNTAVVSSGGTWATGNSPDNTTLFGPRRQEAGRCPFRQVFFSTTSAAGLGGSLAATVVTSSITPTSKANPVLINAAATCAANLTSNQALVATAQVRRGTSTSLVPSLVLAGASPATPSGARLLSDIFDLPGVSTSQAYTIYANNGGSASGATLCATAPSASDRNSWANRRLDSSYPVHRARHRNCRAFSFKQGKHHHGCFRHSHIISAPSQRITGPRPSYADID